MAIFTPEELLEQLTAWKAALLALSSGQEYQIGTRRLRRSDLAEVRRTLEWLNEELDTVNGRSRRANAIPRSDTW